MNQTGSYSKILGFFSRILKEDPEHYARVNAATSNIYFEGECLVFDLPSLYDFIFTNDELSFIAFKQMLYASELNKQLTAQGGKVVIIENKGNINKSLYGLSRSV